VDCQEVLCHWLAGDGVRPIASVTGLDRKTVRKFLAAALGLGFKPGDMSIAERGDSNRRPADYKPVRPHSRQPTGVAETVVALFSNDDMIEQLDSEDFTGFADTFG
jgi:hypothetical protein